MQPAPRAGYRNRLGPACVPQGSNAASCGCRTQTQNAHRTRFGEVLYRWHPWAGARVFIHSAVQRADRLVFRCTLSGSDADRWLEIPAWMFDRATCLERDKISAVPYVSASALSGLADLLLSVSRAQATSSSLLPSGASRVSRDQNRGDAHVGEARGTSCTISMERDETRSHGTSEGAVRQRVGCRHRYADMARRAERDATHADRAAGSIARGPRRSERSRLRNGGRP